jgi:dienelactone hydrolase
MADNEVKIPADGADLGGELLVPPLAAGLVIFAHGSGSSRHSPRNQFVAQTLHQAGLGTLLFDLLTAEEELAEVETRHLRFNISFLAERLIQATRWAQSQETARDLNLGYFGSSTGAGAALVAAAAFGSEMRAIVSRGGRPDLAGAALGKVTAATLLIVGGDDQEVVRLNEGAYTQLKCEKVLRIVRGASHLFEEPGTLETVAGMASKWFADHLQKLP